jgi:hypothetical protein
VVVGALSRSGVKGLIIGNTAESLIDDLLCDLLVVKPAQFVCPVFSESNGPRLLANAGAAGSALFDPDRRTGLHSRLPRDPVVRALWCQFEPRPWG